MEALFRVRVCREFLEKHARPLCEMEFSILLNGHVGAWNTKLQKYVAIDRQRSGVPFTKAAYDMKKALREIESNIPLANFGLQPTLRIRDYDETTPENVIQFTRVGSEKAENTVLRLCRTEIFDKFKQAVQQTLVREIQKTDLHYVPTLNVIMELVLLKNADMPELCVVQAFHLADTDPNIELHVGSLAFKTVDGRWDIEYGDPTVKIETK